MRNHKTLADRVALTEEGMHYANPGLLVVFNGRNETVHLRILGWGVKGPSSFL